MMSRTSDILEEITRIKQEMEEVKEEFKDYIKDKNVPLEERWKVFCKAPSEMKETQSWCVDFKAFTKEVVWYDDFHVDRYQTVDMSDLVSNIKQELEQCEGNLEECRVHNRTGITLKGLEKLKEEILEKNLESFIYDW